MRTTDLVAPDLTYRQIEHWISQGYVPGIQTHGSGVPTEVTDEQADWLVTMGRLVKAGFRPARAAEIITKAHVRPDTNWRGLDISPTAASITGGQEPIIITFTYGRNTQ